LRREASHILRYLSNNNGLAPEEAKPIFWEAEHRTFRTQEARTASRRSCNAPANYGHTIGRVLASPSSRRV